MNYLLCKQCKKRHSSSKEAKPAKSGQICYICQGKLELLPSLCEQALGFSKRFEWSTFNVQAKFGRALHIREEEVFDGEPITEAMAIKNQANQMAIKYLKAKSKKPALPEGELTFVLDFEKGEGKAIPANLYLFGHYIKKTREYCQHDWACMSCRGKGCKQCNFSKETHPSIETAFRKIFAPAFGASNAMLHASGREDVDVMMLGTGRPFVLEIVCPQKRHADLSSLANSLASQFPLEAKNLQYCQKFWNETVCTSHFDKHYQAIIEGERALGISDWQKISSRLPISLNQKTPLRVLRRRSDIIRKRTVYGMDLSSCENGKLTVNIWAEAGTYIKELIHGDGGRTVPSISSILKMQCQCAQLDVIGIDDSFCNTLRA